MQLIKGKEYNEIRCDHCDKLIIWEFILAGRMILECPRCKKVSVYNFKYSPTNINSDLVKKDFQLHNGGRKE